MLLRSPSRLQSSAISKLPTPTAPTNLKTDEAFVRLPGFVVVEEINSQGLTIV